MELSIFLNKGVAHGYVFVEEGDQTQFESEFHEILAQNDMIIFKQ